ncbi:MAG: hypothetical protein R3321_08685, partial [Nitrososphaeraceae archaeon]|nr:hypothetical protein [Nitrososphaeraceae archaeon]
NYQRTFPLNFNSQSSSQPIIKNTATDVYNDVGSPIFITAGTGGVSLHGLGKQAEFNAKQIGKFGYLNIAITGDNGEKLVGTFLDNNGDQLDTFTITKSIVSSSVFPLQENASNTSNVGLDEFGINKIYPTRQGGDEWFMNNDNIKSDPRLKIGSGIKDIIKNQDGSWSPTPQDKVVLEIYTSNSSGKFNKSNMTTYELNELAKKGYWFNEDDWTNIEITGYFKVNSTSDPSSGFSFLPRSISHSNDNGGCGGATPISTFGFNGELQAKKEMWHLSLISSETEKISELSTSIAEKWVGIKAIIYNLPNNDVKQEFWIDKENNGKWEKVYEFTDEGGFGQKGQSGPEKCGGKWDQRYTWGSPIVMIKWNQADVQFKDLSVREIVPPN